MKYFTRLKIEKDGTLKELKVPEKVAVMQIRKLLKRDKEMLEILEKL